MANNPRPPAASRVELSLLSGYVTMTGSCLSVPSEDRSGGLLWPGVLGGGVDSIAGELVLEGEERAGLEGFDRDEG